MHFRQAFPTAIASITDALRSPGAVTLESLPPIPWDDIERGAVLVADIYEYCPHLLTAWLRRERATALEAGALDRVEELNGLISDAAGWGV